jgi:hypothetical protein
LDCNFHWYLVLLSKRKVPAWIPGRDFVKLLVSSATLRPDLEGHVVIKIVAVSERPHSGLEGEDNTGF